MEFQWISGKIHERLGEYDLALQCFKNGLAVRPTQPDLAIEASLAAVYVGAGEEAEHYARIAVTARPTDAGHRADLALALLVAGKAPDALRAAEESLKIAPGDPTTLTLHKVISLIVKEGLPCPKNMAGLQKLAKEHEIKNVSRAAVEPK